jgi:ketosteroid isomerase-like protein
VTCADVVRRFVETLEDRDWEAWSALLHPDVVYEIPQTRERIRGRDGYLQFNREFPGDWHLTPTRVIADDEHGVVRFDWRVGDESAEAMAFFTVTDGLITEVTDFWPEPYEPPPGREHLVERWSRPSGL